MLLKEDNQVCYPSHLQPDEYTQPTQTSLPDDVIKPNFIKEHSKETKDSYYFDYRRGRNFSGTYGEYDLTKGMFTCFSSELDSQYLVQKTIKAHLRDSEDNAFRALALQGNFYNV